MANDPITGARYPEESDSGDVALWIKRAVNDLSTEAVPRFTTTTARDNAYSAAITAGTITAVEDGMLCVVNGVPYRRIGGSWRIDRTRLPWRTADYSGAPKAISSGGANQTGLTSGVPGLSSLTLYEASRVTLNAVFRVGPDTPGSGAALCYLIVNGSVVSTPLGVQRTNDTATPVMAGVDLSAGSHSIAFRVEALSGAVTWYGANCLITEGIAE